MSVPWIISLQHHDIKCPICFFSRELSEGIRLGHCEENGSCTDVNGCRRRKEIIEYNTPCASTFNGTRCEGKKGHEGPHHFSSTSWSEGLSDPSK